MTIELNERELRLLIQSLDHCIATCQRKGPGESTPCEDCETAESLRERLAAGKKS